MRGALYERNGFTVPVEQSIHRASQAERHHSAPPENDLTHNFRKRPHKELQEKRLHRASSEKVPHRAPQEKRLHR